MLIFAILAVDSYTLRVFNGGKNYIKLNQPKVHGHLHNFSKQVV